jgi:lysophospholipase L1-like esterase
MVRAYFLLLSLLIPLVLASDLMGADWVWSNGTPGEQETAYLRKSFDLKQTGAAEVSVAADNSYELFVNGKLVGQGSEWSTAERFDITPLLKVGKNVIAVRATNAGGPGACMLSGNVKNGNQSIDVSTNATWKAAIIRRAQWSTPDLDDSSWPKAYVFGEVGKTAPWGAVALESNVTQLAVPAKRPARRNPFAFKGGDRVVMLGGTFIERAQRYGWIETQLQLASPNKQISFRNLGWSADTVWAQSRGIFDAPSVGYARMIKQVRELKPTVILMHYGTNEAFKGDAGLDLFLEQYERLINDVSTTNAEIVLLSPIAQIKMPAPLPDPTRVNKLTARYSAALKDFAKAQDLKFVDLWTEHAKISETGQRFSDNGIHLNANGYQFTASVLVKGLLGNAPSTSIPGPELTKINEQTIDKNRMYFYRWRPQNVTYLFGFRKHEQGNNAKEVKEFDPIVLRMEKKIFELKQTALGQRSKKQ